MLRLKPKLARLKVDTGDVPQYRAFVRRHACVVPGCDARQIEAAHRRAGVPEDERGGVGMKPHDKWCYPCCHDHHAEQHRIGEETFAAKYKIDTLKLPTVYWAAWLKTSTGIKWKLQAT